MAVQDPDRIGTPALGLHILEKTQDEGNADPVNIRAGVIEVTTAADLLNEAVSRAARSAASQVVKLNGHGNGNGNKDIGTWVRWAAGLVLTLLALTWGGSLLLAARPTEDKIDAKIKHTRQHPDSKAQLSQHEDELHIQKLQLNTIEGSIKNIDKTLGEIKKDLKEKR